MKYLAIIFLLAEHLTEAGAAFHGRIVQDPASGKKMVIIKDPEGNCRPSL